MARFSIVKKGYSVDEVEGFITKLLSLTEDKLKEQTSRINELKGEIKTLNLEKAELKARESSVSKALSEAMKRASEIERLAESRYAIELGRLKLFRKRFTDFIKNFIDKNSLDSAIIEFNQKVSEIENELSSVMEQEFNLEKSFESVDQTEVFDLQDAITPKETLEEICRELGLI